MVGVGTGTDINGTNQTFTAKAVGGEYLHSLSIEEMPTHSHKILSAGQTGSTGPWGYEGVWDGKASMEGGGRLSDTGGGAAHNNLQPYIVTYMWKRIE